MTIRDRLLPHAKEYIRITGKDPKDIELINSILAEWNKLALETPIQFTPISLTQREGLEEFHKIKKRYSSGIGGSIYATKPSLIKIDPSL